MKGKCPEWGKVLVKDSSRDFSSEQLISSLDSAKVRCPSCNSSWHQLSELEWSE